MCVIEAILLWFVFPIFCWLTFLSETERNTSLSIGCGMSVVKFKTSLYLDYDISQWHCSQICCLHYSEISLYTYTIYIYTYMCYRYIIFYQKFWKQKISKSWTHFFPFLLSLHKISNLVLNISHYNAHLKIYFHYVLLVFIEHNKSYYFKTAMTQPTPYSCLSVLLLVKYTFAAYGYFVHKDCENIKKSCSFSQWVTSAQLT